MRKAIKKEFGSSKPRALVLDDNAGARHMTARHFRRRGFVTIECASAKEFFEIWKPGTVDVVIADWQLSSRTDELGDRVLEQVRRRDWEVPFVLISGKLGEDADRVVVLEKLLASGAAHFVRRGNDGIQKACERAEDLIERRDQALLRVILALREGALRGEKIKTSGGEKSVASLLEDHLSKPASSHDAERPIAAALAKS